MNITVLFSKATRRALASPYADTEEDTVESAGEVARALTQKGAVVTSLPIDEDHIERIGEIHADMIFNLIEWTGLDLPLADRAFAAIEKTGIPVTGATRANYLLTSDKSTMKVALERHALPTARFQIFARGDEAVRDDFRYPVIVKPALEHCSIGLTHEAVVHTPDELSRRAKERVKTFEQAMVAEEFIEGREFQVTALESASGVFVLPPAEIIFTTKTRENLLTFDSRWDSETTDYKTSHVALAGVSRHLEASIADITKRTFRLLGMRDYTRLDIRTRGEEVYILEANSNPGLSDDMEYGMTLSYRAIGWEFADFIWEIVASTTRRIRRPTSAA